jgi:hypothetical protein
MKELVFLHRNKRIQLILTELQDLKLTISNKTSHALKHTIMHVVVLIFRANTQVCLRRFTRSLRGVYAEFTWKAFPQPMCVNLRRASLRKVYAKFTQGATC